MHFAITAVGRLKAGAERDLFGVYTQRIAAAGKPLSMGALKTVEVSQSRAGSTAERRAQEAALLMDKLGSGAHLIAMDETGNSLSSNDFAGLLARLREAGTSELAFAIGGPDGHGRELIGRADARMALGPMTLPHGLVRIILAEQIYRALTILAGHPYHRA